MEMPQSASGPMGRIGASRSPFATAIASSHARCRHFGVKRNSRPKPGPVPLVYPQRAFLGNGIIKDILSDFHSYIHSLGGSTLYAYDDMRVLDPWDNLNVLSGDVTGIQPGVDLHEECSGTTAACLVGNGNHEAWVVGDEHYLEVLSPYATYCNYAKDSDGGFYTFVIVPKENFTSQMLSYTRLLQRAKREAILRFKIQTEKTALEEFARNRNDLTSSATILVDRFGRMLWGNDLFLRAFGVSNEEVRDRPLSSLLSDFEPFETAVKNGTLGDGQALSFSRSTRHGFLVYAGATPIGDNDSMGYSLRFKVVLGGAQGAGARAGARYRFDDIVGESAVMKAALAEATEASLSESAVLLLGESGTGKELFAQSIHNASMRCNGPFVPLNCANLHHDLIESELFGYVGGAFTGANRQGAMGKIEYADHGTLFLDEIGELPLSAQVMLLRVLEEKAITRLGSNKQVPVDFRLICATNRDLEAMVAEGSFRLDLYYRINVLPISLPPLRDRDGDIELLAKYFIYTFNEALGTQVKQVSAMAGKYLKAYRWPGNLREMRNVFERAVQHADGIIRLEDLPQMLVRAVDDDAVGHGQMPGSGGRPGQGAAAGVQAGNHQGTSFEDAERHMLVKLYLETGGNKSRMAQELGVSRTTLYKKIKALGL